MPDWLKILGALGGLAAIWSAYVGFRKWRREDRDRVAAYLDRVSVMLAELADDIEKQRASPARLAELSEAIIHVGAIVRRSGVTRIVRNDLLEALTVTARNRSESVMELQIISNALHAPGIYAPSSHHIEKMRETSGMFKGAAEAVKVR